MIRWVLHASSWMLAYTAVATAVVPQADPRVQVFDVPTAVSDFTLINQDGRAVRFGEFRGREAFVFFGFTHCASICPAALLKLRQLANALEGSGQRTPAIVLVSVDGDRDTPAALRDYLQGFPSDFIGLTGDPQEVRMIAADFKAVFFKGLPYDNAGNYQVEHTSMIYLVDAEGRLRATFIDAPVEAMAETTRRLTARLD